VFTPHDQPGKSCHVYRCIHVALDFQIISSFSAQICTNKKQAADGGEEKGGVESGKWHKAL